MDSASKNYHVILLSWNYEVRRQNNRNLSKLGGMCIGLGNEIFAYFLAHSVFKLATY